MPIIINEKENVITIHTKNSTYQMKADEQGTLFHTYYGSRINETDMSYRICSQDRGFSGNPYAMGVVDRAYSTDLYPQEYSCFGTGDFRISGLHVRNQDGSRGCELRFVKATVEDGKYGLEGLPAVYADKAETLKVVLKDPYSGIEVELLYGILEELDVITRAAKIINHGSAQVFLEKAASLSVDWNDEDFDFITFYGRHNKERTFQRENVSHGIQSIGSVRGNSSHHYNPFSILCSKDATEDKGECYGFSMLYSGEFLMEIEKDQINQIRFICGIHPDNFTWVLEPEQTFTTPEVMMVYSDRGFSHMSHCIHKAIRNHVCRGVWKKHQRPVLINNWEATYFDFTGDKLVEIAKDAFDMGIELFVMDDGWFGKRDDDNSGLGDWYPNEKKLGCTLKELGEKITETGMKFGIWFEPESISIDSDLYRAHPDWVIQQPGRLPNLSRNELVLDFSREDVQDYILERIRAILTEAPISYIKWDMNRSICDKYSNQLDALHQGEFAHRYILGLYRVFEAIYQEFPEVLIESCSGGGGRFDAGILYYTPQIWCSDNTDAISRLDIQYGTSFGYPVSTMGAHVSAVPNHQTGRITPIETRGCVAMSGTFGYELDITKMTAEDKEVVRHQIERFHELYSLIQYGDYYRLISPKHPYTVWEFVNENKSEALVNAVHARVEACMTPIHVKIKGLKEDANYLVTLLDEEMYEKWHLHNCILSGAALMKGGITFPLPWMDYQSMQYYIREI